MKLKLNNNRIINIELQVAYQPDWAERSLDYLCCAMEDNYIYTRKLTLAVINLKQIDRATEKDIVRDWARLFQATTWEELMMIAKNRLKAELSR